MKIEERTPFGKRLFEARIAAGLTQEQAAKNVGMSQGTLAEAEISGKRSGYTSQLAALYNVSATYLATGTGRPTENSTVTGDYKKPKESAEFSAESPLLVYNQLSSDEQALVIAWRNCSQEQRDMFRLIVSQVAKNATKAA